MRALAIVPLLAACGADPSRTPPEPRAQVSPRLAEVDPRPATRRAAHAALAEHCGECHEGHRATAQAKALAVFDLDQPDWPARFDDHRFEAALRRLAKKPAAAPAALVALRKAERPDPPPLPGPR
jgi:hypothetical protein